MSLLERTRTHARKLLDLMNSPEPGLLTWNGMVAGHIEGLARDLGASRLRELADELEGNPARLPGRKRVAIVFQETNPNAKGMGFDLFIEGVDTTRLKTIPEEQWSTADWWGVRMFNLVVHHVKQTSAVQSETPKKKR